MGKMLGRPMSERFEGGPGGGPPLERVWKWGFGSGGGGGAEGHGANRPVFLAGESREGEVMMNLHPCTDAKNTRLARRARCRQIENKRQLNFGEL